MTNRQLCILTGVAVVMVVVTVLLHVGSGGPESSFVSGTALIQGLDPDQVRTIVIKSDKETVTLARGQDGGFVVREKQNYPASMKAINELIVKALDIRCKQEVTDNPEHHKELGVAEGEGVALAVTFLNTEGQPIIGFVMGTRAEIGGVYVRIAGQDTVYASERYLWLNSEPMNYIEEQLLAVNRADIERVGVTVGEDGYVIGLDKKAGTPVLQNVPEGKQAKTNEVGDVFEALTGLDMADVVAADKIKPAWDATYTCRLKSGLRYTVRLAKDGDKHYARLRAKQPPGGPVTIDGSESDEQLKKNEAFLKAVAAAEAVRLKHEAWVYELAGWKAGRLRRPLAELIEDIPKETTPEEISASHILIAYKGAERAQATRTKAAAQTLAETVLKLAQAEGADFASLARKHSDGPSKDKGGDLGPFKKGAMAPAFEEAAFKLEVGKISGIVETPFGFHIIKRTK